MQRFRIRQTPYRLRNQRKGKKVFENVKKYSCYEDGREFCTTARKFIRRYNCKPPCIVTVLKSNGKDAKYFYSNTGLFKYSYALANHRQFSKELKNISK